MRFGPAPMTPRRPAVPNSSEPAKRSGRSVAMGSGDASSAAISARVSGSGSYSAHAFARLRSSGSSMSRAYHGTPPCGHDAREDARSEEHTSELQSPDHLV